MVDFSEAVRTSSCNFRPLLDRNQRFHHDVCLRRSRNPCVVTSGGRSMELATHTNTQHQGLTAAHLSRQVRTCARSRSTAASTSARVLQAPSTASACPDTRSTRMEKPAQVRGLLAPPPGGSRSWTVGTGTTEDSLFSGKECNCSLSRDGDWTSGLK